MTFKVQELAKYGVTYFGGAPKLATAMDKMRIAQDADMVTAPNGGVLSLFTTYVDPEAVRVLFAPQPLTEVFPEVQKGDWTTTSMTFPVVEVAGKPVTYGDWNENGTTSANVNFESRQPYDYQQFVRWGEKEQEMYGNAKIDWTSELQVGVSESLVRMAHEIYAFGVSGLKNYGMLNDPNLLPQLPIATAWSFTDPMTILADIQTIFKQLVKQSNGLVKRNDNLVLLMSPEQEATLNATNQYGLQAIKLIKDSYPNIEIQAIPEYSTDAGEVVQMILRKYNGSDTVQLAYASKMRVHNLVVKASGWEQKRSQSTYGAIIRRPMFVVTALVATTP